MGQFWRDENYLDGGGWWLLFMIVFWGLAFILPLIYFIAKDTPKHLKNIPNFIKRNSDFFKILFVIITIFILTISISYISVNIDF